MVVHVVFLHCPITDVVHVLLPTGEKVMGLCWFMSVCVCVSVFVSVNKTTVHILSTTLSMHIAYGSRNMEIFS